MSRLVFTLSAGLLAASVAPPPAWAFDNPAVPIPVVENLLHPAAQNPYHTTFGGNFVFSSTQGLAVWHQGGDLVVNTVSASGAPLSPWPSAIGDPPDRGMPALSATTDDRFLVAWRNSLPGNIPGEMVFRGIDANPGAGPAVWDNGLTVDFPVAGAWAAPRRSLGAGADGAERFAVFRWRGASGGNPAGLWATTIRWGSLQPEFDGVLLPGELSIGPQNLRQLAAANLSNSRVLLVWRGGAEIRGAVADFSDPAAPTITPAQTLENVANVAVGVTVACDELDGCLIGFCVGNDVALEGWQVDGAGGLTAGGTQLVEAPNGHELLRPNLLYAEGGTWSLAASLDDAHAQSVIRSVNIGWDSAIPAVAPAENGPRTTLMDPAGNLTGHDDGFGWDIAPDGTRIAFDGRGLPNGGDERAHAFTAETGTLDALGAVGDNQIISRRFNGDADLRFAVNEDGTRFAAAWTSQLPSGFSWLTGSALHTVHVAGGRIDAGLGPVVEWTQQIGDAEESPGLGGLGYSNESLNLVHEGNDSYLVTWVREPSPFVGITDSDVQLRRVRPALACTSPTVQLSGVVGGVGSNAPIGLAFNGVWSLAAWVGFAPQNPNRLEAAYISPGGPLGCPAPVAVPVAVPEGLGTFSSNVDVTAVSVAADPGPPAFVLTWNELMAPPFEGELETTALSGDPAVVWNSQVLPLAANPLFNAPNQPSVAAIDDIALVAWANDDSATGERVVQARRLTWGLDPALTPQVFELDPVSLPLASSALPIREVVVRATNTDFVVGWLGESDLFFEEHAFGRVVSLDGDVYGDCAVGDPCPSEASLLAICPGQDDRRRLELVAFPQGDPCMDIPVVAICDARTLGLDLYPDEYLPAEFVFSETLLTQDELLDEGAGDPYCAQQGGGGGEGDCCAANGSPGCEVPACEATICAMDAYCCDVAWDSVCVNEALVYGGTDCSCSSGGGGACGVPTSWAGCTESTTCESCVCGADPYCCNNQWDQLCVDATTTSCATACE